MPYKNKEDERAYNRKYYAEHKEEMAKASREYCKKHRTEIRAKDNNRREANKYKWRINE